MMFSIGHLTVFRSPFFSRSTMTTMLRDLMLVCRNGHVITDRLKARPDLRLPRCDRCGSDTLDRCETCCHLLAGANPVPGFEPLGFRGPPKTCTTCGAAFPWAFPNSPPDDELLTKLEHLLRRLPRVARELQLRPGSPFAVRRERDLDDLIRVLLPIHFHEVRPEARTPRYCAGTRTAFVLPEIEAAVVGHLMLRSVDENELTSVLSEDLEYYQRGGGCRTVVLFISDPESRLVEPARLEARWSGLKGTLIARCVIA